MKLKLLDVSKMIEVDTNEDPLKYYKMPVVRWFYFRRLHLFSRVIKDRKFDRILDLGYGSGIMLPDLAARSKELYGLDKHGKGKEVSEILSRENVKANLVDGNILEMPFQDEFFDCVNCVSVLDHIADLEKASSEIYRVLKKGGTLYIGLVIQNILTNTAFEVIHAPYEYHVSRYYQIRDVFKKKFSLKQTKKFPFFMPEKLALYICWEFEK